MYKFIHYVTISPASCEKYRDAKDACEHDWGPNLTLICILNVKKVSGAKITLYLLGPDVLSLQHALHHQ